MNRNFGTLHGGVSTHFGGSCYHLVDTPTSSWWLVATMNSCPFIVRCALAYGSRSTTAAEETTSTSSYTTSGDATPSSCSASLFGSIPTGSKRI